jgi:hypothetical protein
VTDTEKTRDQHGIEPDAETREIDGAPSIDSLLAGIAKQLGLDTETGWGAIDDAGAGLQKQRNEQMQAMKREANIFRDTFSTPAGRECLRIMTEMTIDADAYPADANLAMDTITALVIAADAQRKFVRAIYQAIAFAENREARTRTVT